MSETTYEKVMNSLAGLERVELEKSNDEFEIWKVKALSEARAHNLQTDVREILKSRRKKK